MNEKKTIKLETLTITYKKHNRLSSASNRVATRIRKQGKRWQRQRTRRWRLVESGSCKEFRTLHSGSTNFLVIWWWTPFFASLQNLHLTHHKIYRCRWRLRQWRGRMAPISVVLGGMRGIRTPLLAASSGGVRSRVLARALFSSGGF